jgi:hypothetical protein
MRISAALMLLILECGVTPAQTSTPPLADPQQMPSNIAADSYQIYSDILGKFDSWSSTDGHFLVLATTIPAVPAGQNCEQQKPQREETVDPNGSDSDPNQKRNFQEVMEGFDAHCHDVLSLTADSFETSLPVRLLSRQEANVEGFEVSPKWAQGYRWYLFEFSEVYFNYGRNFAIVHVEARNGGPSPRRNWLTFQLRNGKWERFHGDVAPWLH